MPLKKIIILAYFFPPANFAGSYRVGSWARHLHKFGYYPIIITRCWNTDQTTTTSQVEDNTFRHERYDTHEVYRIPYHNNLRDRLHTKYGDSRFVILRKALTLMELILQNFINAAIPYHNLYDFALELLQKEKDIRCVILSGRPFQLFKFGYLLHRKTGIKWIADYRDEWNTHQWLLDESLSRRIIRMLESRAEKKWLRTASLFTTCSDNWVTQISSYIGRPGRVVLNGYEDNLMAQRGQQPSAEAMTIVHNGTVYSSQPTEIFLEGYKKFIDTHPGARVQLLFPGVDNDPAEGHRIRQAMAGYERYYQTTPRIPKDELIRIMSSAHLYLLIGTQGVKGHHSSKIFEYLAMGRPVILCPDDHDVMHELMQDTNAGFITSTPDETAELLSDMYQKFKDGQPISVAMRPDRVAFYSRENQAGRLAKILDEVTG